MVARWAWPSILGLDAPTVAVAWSWALAHAAGAPFSWGDAAVVGFATMAAYLLDRRLDVRSIGVAGTDGSRPATLRHAWVASHPRTITLLAGGAGLTACLATLALPPISLAWGVPVAGFAVLAVLAPDRKASSVRAGGTLRALPRSVAVGLVFAAAAALPAADGDWTSLLPALAGLAAVAALNVRLIATGEAHLDDGTAAEATDPGIGVWIVAGPLAVVLILARPWLAGLGAALALAALLLGAADLTNRASSGGGRSPELSGAGYEARHLAADLALVVALLALPLK